MRHMDLFTGIGGFALAAQRTWKEGYEPVVFCEQNEFCQQVLNKHWPAVPIENDIHHLKGGKYGTIDLITAGYPCQGESKLGKLRGKEDHRWLWPEVNRIIKHYRPNIFIGENTANHYRMGLDQVQDDLEAAGYTSRAFSIPASSVGACHERERIWVIAHNDSKRVEGSGKEAISWESGISWSENVGGSEDLRDRSNISQPRLCRTRHGIAERLDSLGNSIVPQVAQVIMTAIRHIMETHHEKKF